MAEPAVSLPIPPAPVSSLGPAPAAIVPTTTIITNGPPTDIDESWNGDLPTTTSSTPLAAIETPGPGVQLDASGAVVVPGLVAPITPTTSPLPAPIDLIPPSEAISVLPMPAPVNPPISSAAIPPGAVSSLALPPPAAITSAPPIPLFSSADAPGIFSSAIDLKDDAGDLPPVLEDNDRPRVSSTRTRISTTTSSKDLLLSAIPPSQTRSSARSTSTSINVVLDQVSSKTVSTAVQSSTLNAATSSTKELFFVNPSSSFPTSRTVWDLVGSSTSGAISATSIKPDAYPGMLKISSVQSSSIMPMGLIASSTTSGIVVPSGIPAQSTTISSAASQPTLPPPGSPEESNIRAVVSSTITLTGSMAVAAIKAGATQLDSKTGTEKTVTEGDVGGLNGFAIAGIVGGGVLGLAILGLVWSKWRNKTKPKDDDPNMKESQRPDTAFSFSDDPITASTGRFRETIIAENGSGPFDDRYRSRYGNEERGTWYEPNQGHLEGHDTENHHIGEGRDDLEELYGTAIEAERARRTLQNPFDPPVPPIPESTSRSLRPETGFTDIYGSYESRPTTQIQQPPSAAGLPYDQDDDRDLPMQTPATSSLLPWLQKPRAAPLPPVPELSASTRAVKPNERSKGKRIADVPQDVDDGRQYTTYESNAAGVGAPKGMMQQRPARPVMAQTPAGAGENGFHVLIPGFR